MTETYNLPRNSLIKRINWYEKKHGPYVESKGSKNWKNLFKKPTLQEIIIFVMLIMSLFLWWAYNNDMETCREVIAECNAYMNQVNPYLGNISINFDKFENITFVNHSKGVNNDPLE